MINSINYNTRSTVSCPTGDVTGVIKNGQTCSEIVTSTNRECYNTTTETNCCASCNAVATSKPDCKYGDRTPGCVVFLCPSIINIADCCDTCIDDDTTTVTTTTATTTTTTSQSSTTSSVSSTTTTGQLGAQNDTTQTASTSDRKHSLSDSEVAGAVIGSLAGACAIVATVLLVIWLHKKNQNTVWNESSDKKKQQTGTDIFGRILDIQTNGITVGTTTGPAMATDMATTVIETTTKNASSKLDENELFHEQASTRGNVQLEPIQTSVTAHEYDAHAYSLAPNPLPPFGSQAGI
ncbi:hypothetical protein DPMN_187611 [Dreissena polymorpha]|uniref:Uncharacterized protein n=1 Tax=Dreissena polymorpha TaxID=45954 RepID=A0A9D4DPE6_DREPO|nr:hypothetical protein DPMN_187611 [Dreissena polymorpha]